MTPPTQQILQEVKEFLEDMHIMPPEWTVEQSQPLHSKVSALLAAHIHPTPQDAKDVQRSATVGPSELAAVLRLLLDKVDYTKGACGLSDMVGACLDPKIIDRARAALLSYSHGTRVESAPSATASEGLSEGVAGEPVFQVRDDIERCHGLWLGNVPPHGTLLYAAPQPATKGEQE